MDSIKLIILAAGKGKRMKSDLPKVLIPFNDKPLIKHLLDSIKHARISHPPTIIVGTGADMVKATLGDGYHYVEQKEQLGTGHAVLVAEKELRGKADHIMVLYGDHPLVDAQTVEKIAKAHIEGNNPITMATVEVDDFDGWKAGFYDYGRIVRNGGGEIHSIVELKDATEEQKKITEVNPSYFCFNSEWLWENLRHLNNKNSQGEYYLTSLPHMARDRGEKISSVQIDPITALGANTAEQLSQIKDVVLKERITLQMS